MMTVANALKQLTAAGVTVSIDGPRLVLTPAAAVPPDLHTWLSSGQWRAVYAYLRDLETAAVQHADAFERRYHAAARIRLRHGTGLGRAAEIDARCRSARQRRAQRRRGER